MIVTKDYVMVGIGSWVSDGNTIYEIRSINENTVDLRMVIFNDIEDDNDYQYGEYDSISKDEFKTTMYYN